MKLSVALATFNEEVNLPRCLESVKNIADEIIVVDGMSHDQTKKIAKQMGAQVFLVPNDPNNFHSMKQKALEHCRGDWVLQLDADEFVSPALAKEIKETINKKNDCDGYFIPRKNWFLGKFLQKGGAYPDPVLRLFKNSKAKFSKQKMVVNTMTTSSVHAQIEIDGKVDTLKHDLIHNGDPELGKYLKRFNRYTSIEAENLLQLGFKKNMFSLLNYMFLKPCYWFLMRFVRHRGYVDGWQGFLFALFSALHYPVIYLKIGTYGNSGN
ncbi:glycosyltransferase family 2 protein [Candidatus Beckwithbacteria bacterium]|nr:glycosyltransferase family 2 protein [Candidatus Beckwithbacteria bacterium]